MKHRLWPPALALCVLALGCRGAPAEPASRPPRVTEVRYLGEWLTWRDMRCQVPAARAVLTEAAAPRSARRVKPDLHVIAVELRCVDARGATLALPDDMTVWLDAPDGTRRGVSLRALLPQADNSGKPLLFEIPHEARWLRPRPRYDARTGARLGRDASGIARLSLQRGAQRRQVVLDSRAYDWGLQAFLDQLAQVLAGVQPREELATARAGHETLAQLAAIYQGLAGQLSPRVLALSSVQVRGSRLEVTLTLDAAGLDESGPQADLALELSRAAGELALVGSAGDLAEVREAMACAGLERALHERIRQGFARLQVEPTGALVHRREADDFSAANGAEKRVPECNVLGQLLPGRCAEVGHDLLSDALRIGMRCTRQIEERFGHAQRRRPPADFHLTLRRGRAPRGLDNHPRYAVTLFANGQVTFHGRHWVSRHERSDGRTATALLWRLYGEIVAMDWFGRPGGSRAGRRCDAHAPTGDLITVRAGGRERTVLHREGCRGPFTREQLDHLRRSIELVAGTDGWTRPRPSYADPDAQTWLVRAD